MSSPFTMMAGALTAHAMPAWSGEEPIPLTLSRTERIRRLLKSAIRPITANEIAWDMADHFPNFGSHLVWLLLKHDISKGRVVLDAGRYSWNREYDSELAQAIRSAKKLLTANGYQVEAPGAAA